MTDETPKGADTGQTVENGERPEDQTQTGDAQPDSKPERTEWKTRYLTEVVPAQEEKNRLKREVEELRQRLNQPPTQNATDPRAQQEAVRRQRYYELASIADRDPAAAVLLDQAARDEEYRLEQQRKLMWMEAEIEIGRLPETERDGVRRNLQSGDFRNVVAARKAYLGDQSETREKERSEREAKEKDQRAAKEARDKAPETATRSAPVTTKEGVIKESEWRQQIAAARERKDYAELQRLRGPDVWARLTTG